MPRWPADDSRQSGFTLIEVLVALAIAGVALAAIVGVFSSSVAGQTAADGAAAALAVAEDHMADAEATAILRPGDSTGVFAGRYRWRVVVAPYKDAGAEPVDPLAATVRLLRIEVTVAWADGSRRRRIALDTLRLGPPAP